MKHKFLNFKLTGSHLLEIIIETIYLLIVFLIPLWFAYLFPNYNMFELGKLIVFRFLAWLLIIFVSIWLIKGARIKKLFSLLRNSGKRQIKNLLWPSVLLILGLLFTLPLSIDSGQSFWGSYTRVQGFYSYLMYFLWALVLFVFLLTTKVIKGDKEFRLKIKRILVISILSGTLVAVYGILQVMNIDFLTWPEQPFLTGRALSFLGQPNFLASFLLLVIPLTSYFFYISSQRLLRFTYFLALIFQLTCLFFTSSRGGLLALFAVIGVFSLVIFFFSAIQKKYKIIIISSLLAVVLLSFTALELFNPGRFQSSLNFKAGSLAARVYFFQSAANAIIEKPIFGYGLEMGSDVFIKYYERDWALHGKVSANADRAHNLILDILVTSGFFGLIIVSLWYYSIFRLGYNEARVGRFKVLSLALTLAIFGYFVSLFFSFTIVAGEVYLWLFVTLLMLLSFDSKEVVGQKESLENEKNIDIIFSNRQKIIAQVVVLIIILISLLALVNNHKALLADYYKNGVYAAVLDSKFIRATELHNKIIDLSVNKVQNEDAAIFLGTKLTSYCSYNSWRDLSEEVIIKNKLNAILDILPDKGYENMFLKAKIYSCLKKDEEANYYFSMVANITPGWPLNYLEWGNHFIKRGDLELAEKYFQLADVNLPDLGNEYINQEHAQAVKNYKYTMYEQLGRAHKERGNYKRANRFFQAAYENNSLDYSLLKKIADCYYLDKDLDSAIRYNEYGAQSNPSDYNWFLALGVLYFENGNILESLSNLNKAYELAPEEKKSDINNLKKEYSLVE